MQTTTIGSARSRSAYKEEHDEGSSLWHDAWLRLRKNRLAAFGMLTLGIIAAACVIGPWFLRYGYEQPRIIFRHILPNIFGPIIVYTTLMIPSVMLLEAFLSFLSLGVPPPMSSWGVLINDGSEKMEEHPWLLLFPGAIFSLTLLSLNFFGDGLRDALDVRSSKD